MLALHHKVQAALCRVGPDADLHGREGVGSIDASAELNAVPVGAALRVGDLHPVDAGQGG